MAMLLHYKAIGSTLDKALPRDTIGHMTRTPLGRSLTILMALVAAAAATACGPDAEERDAAVRAAEQELMAVIDARADSAEAILAEQPGLTADLRSELRRHLNPRQVATARELGVSPLEDSAEVAGLVERGELVRLEDSTDYWVVRELDYSVPYVTPDARAMLVELGQEFHARLDSLGLPAFRFEVTSVLRTQAMQAQLRRGNANASRTTSSHEFGTTVDLAYNSFAPPVEVADSADLTVPDSLDLNREERQRLEERVAAQAAQRFAELGKERAAELKGVLGQVLAEMQGKARVQPLIERSQPVFHMTVATRYDGDGVAGDASARAVE